MLQRINAVSTQTINLTSGFKRISINFAANIMSTASLTMTEPLMHHVALTYIRAGVAIIPCRESDGSETTAKSPYISGGWHSATDDEAQIRDWWRRWPNAAIGLPCAFNRIIAVDADRHGNGDGVTAFFQDCERNGFDPYSVPCVRTPRDGRHLIFHRPLDMGETKGAIGQAIDIRDKAYIIAAGSVMANGAGYTLETGTIEQLAFAIGSRSLTPPYPWIQKLMVKDAPSLISPKFHKAAPKPQYQSEMPQGSSDSRLLGIIRKVISTAPGQRNPTLYWAACRVRDIVAAGGVPIAAAEALLCEAGLRAGLSLAEVRATVASGLTGRGGQGGN